MGQGKDDTADGTYPEMFGIPASSSLESGRTFSFSGVYRQYDFTEHLAQWMLRNGFSTGHGESFVGLLDELEWQVAELREKARGAS